MTYLPLKGSVPLHCPWEFFLLIRVSNQIKFIRYTRSQNTNRKLENKDIKRKYKHEADGVTRTQRQKPALTCPPQKKKKKI